MPIIRTGEKLPQFNWRTATTQFQGIKNECQLITAARVGWGS